MDHPISDVRLDQNRPAGGTAEVDQWDRDRDQGDAILTAAFGETPGDSDADEPVPDRIGKFEIRGVLGEGGAGVVFDAWDPNLHCAVAIKVLKATGPGYPFSAGSEPRARFDREGELLAKLKHPHIVRIYTADVWDGRPYLAMDKVAGGTLADQLAAVSARGPRAVAAFVEKVARAVQFAHDCGVQHRDLKPANILVDERGDPQVSDFGLAKIRDAEPAPPVAAETPGPSNAKTMEMSVTGVQLGTPAYMAPEQYDRTKGSIGPATDIWALGVVLYEVLTETKPFPTGSYGELIAAICDRPPPSCRSIRPAVPRWLEAVVGRCLAKRPKNDTRRRANWRMRGCAGLRPRRRLMTAAAIGLLIAVTAGAYAGGRLGSGKVGHSEVPPPALPFAELPEVVNSLDRLRAGETVDFVGPGIKPVYRQVWADKTFEEVEAAPGELAFLSRWPGPSPIEFLPELPDGRFRVTADLAFSRCVGFGFGGLYVQGWAWEAETARHLTCAWFTLDGPGAGGKFARFQLVHIADRGTAVSPVHRYEAGMVRFNPGPDPDFHGLGLETDPGGVTAFWEAQGRLPLPLPQSQMRKYWEDQQNVFPPRVPSATGPGAIGVVVYNGQVTIRALRVTRLPD